MALVGEGLSGRRVGVDMKDCLLANSTPLEIPKSLSNAHWVWSCHKNTTHITHRNCSFHAAKHLFHVTSQ
jgi:hypothetical protein